MIFKNTLESLEETPLKIQKTLTDLTNLQDKNDIHYSRIEKFWDEYQQNTHVSDSNESDNKRTKDVDMDKIKAVSSSFLKTLESEKKAVILLENLLEFLDRQVDALEEEIVDFKESCATSALMKRSGALDNVLQEQTEDDDDDERYCFCKKSSDGLMVACDGEGCPIEWFHYECVGLTEPPSDKWFCSECSKKETNNV